MKKHPTALAVLLLLFSCTKNENKKDCWQAFDPSGHDARGLVLCDKTQSEAEAQYPQFWFYKSGETKYCWQTQSPRNNNGYARQIPESMAQKLSDFYGMTFTKLDCESFCVWTLHDKFRSKTTGQFSPVQLRREIFQRDSCSKLFVGRVLVLKETADSIYTREFVSKDE